MQKVTFKSFFLCVILQISVVKTNCPSKCECRSGKMLIAGKVVPNNIVSCMNMNLKQISADVPTTTTTNSLFFQKVDLGGGFWWELLPSFTNLMRLSLVSTNIILLKTRRLFSNKWFSPKKVR